MSTNYENVKNWIMNSGLVVTNQEDENYGAVHSFYDQNKEKYGFLYPEITGYSVSAFSFLYGIDNNEIYKKMAKASSDWIIGIFDKYGAIIQGIDKDKNSREQLAYSFDTAICAKGLLDCFKLTNDDKFLNSATSLVNWLKKSITDQGTVLPFMELSTNEFKESNKVWYKKWGCLHIKTSIPFILLYKITNDKSYLESAHKICNTYSRFQNPDGSFKLHEKDNTINLHTMSYALEGLLYTFSISKNDEYLDSIEKSLDWCTKQIKNDNSIELWFNSKYKSKAVYPIAQLIRLMILIDKYHDNSKYKNNILQLYSFLINLQAKENNPKIYGGLYEEYYKTLFGWKKRKKLNSWGSLFAIQALYWYDNYDTIKFDSISKLY